MTHRLEKRVTQLESSVQTDADVVAILSKGRAACREGSARTLLPTAAELDTQANAGSARLREIARARKRAGLFLPTEG